MTIHLHDLLLMINNLKDIINRNPNPLVQEQLNLAADVYYKSMEYEDSYVLPEYEDDITELLNYVD